jgi:DNA-binding phage protein
VSLRITSESNDIKKVVPKTIAEQVAKDLARHLDKFTNKSFGLRTLADEAEITQRTIKRLLAQQNQPSYQTLFRLYMVFLGTTDEEIVVEKCPEIIRKELQNRNPKKLRKETKKDYDFSDLINKEPLLGELYILAATGPLHANTVAYRYGQYGIDLLKRLEQLNILKESDKNIYTPAPNGPTLDGKVIKSLGLRFVERFSKPSKGEEKGENILSFYAEGLNDKGLNEWLKLDEENFYKKVEIAKKAEFQGTRPAFTFTATDEISMEINCD